MPPPAWAGALASEALRAFTAWVSRCPAGAPCPACPSLHCSACPALPPCPGAPSGGGWGPGFLVLAFLAGIALAVLGALLFLIGSGACRARDCTPAAPVEVDEDRLVFQVRDGPPQRGLRHRALHGT